MLLDEHVTADFVLSEFIISPMAVRHGVDNMPPAYIMATIRNVLAPSVQHIRDILRAPVFLTSAYRCPALNMLVKGSQDSDHMTGHAVDLVCPRFGSPRKVAEFLVSLMPEFKFDQLIHEGGWVHVSFNSRPRNQVLTAHFWPDRPTSYTPGLS